MRIAFPLSAKPSEKKEKNRHRQLQDEEIHPSFDCMAEKENSDRVVLIAGISGGIGSDLAARFVEDGWKVAGFGRSQEKLDKLTEDHSGISTYEADACDSKAVGDVVEKVLEEHGQIDAYVHCVGSFLLKPAHSTSDEEFEETLLLNLQTAFYGLRAVVKPMMKSDGGTITLVSSVASLAGLPSHEAIAAAKGGINGLVRSAASSYANKGIRVNAVAPGMVETELSKGLLGSDMARQMATQMHPVGRIGKPGDIASLLFWLSQPENSWVTGQVWSVDGGVADVNQRVKV